MSSMQHVVMCVVAMVMMVTASANRPPGPYPGPTAEPGPQRFSYSMNSNLSQWQFQLLLPSFQVSEYKDYESTVEKLFKGYAATNKSQGDLHVDSKSSTVGNMSYWHFPKDEGHIFGAHQTLVKATYLYYGDGAGTSHLATKFRTLWNDSSSNNFNMPNIFNKMDNEVHCRYYDVSRSVEVRNLTADWFNISTVQDMTAFYGPEFPAYIGVAPTVVLKTKKPRTVVSTNWDLHLKVHDSNGVKTKVKAGATLSQEFEGIRPGIPTDCELDMKINRDDISNDDPVLLQNALEAMKELSQYLAESELGIASCKCLVPGAEEEEVSGATVQTHMLGCVTAPPNRRRG